MFRSISKAMPECIKKVRRSLRDKKAKNAYNYSVRKEALKAKRHYVSVVENIKKRGGRIRVAAYVVYAASYAFDSIFRLMLNDEEHWEATIVIIPDTLRGHENQLKTYLQTRVFFVEKYGKEKVIDGWDINKNIYIDCLNQFDVIYYANPYDIIVNKYHKIEYAMDKNVLPIYISYGYDIGSITTKDRLKGRELNLVWKVFADTVPTYKDYKKYQIIKGSNVVIAGYSKMDNLADCVNNTNKQRKKILITPHHTVSTEVLPLSNFLEYYELFLKLPDMFPNVDFVFRPHPLLFVTLENEKIWDKNQIDEYISKLLNKGVEYSTEGDYIHLFSECDAIINDCGSFTVEWLFTGKPGCFMYSKRLNSDFLTTLMNRAIREYTIAETEKDIIDFVAMITNEEESRNGEMSQWVKSEVAINYPNVSKFILAQLSYELIK